MGGMIACIAMSRSPNLISRAAFTAPMLRMKCGTKALDYRFPMPQPITHMVTRFMSWAGLGWYPTLGFFHERPTDPLHLYVTTSDRTQLNHWEMLRQRCPSIMSTCITNDWVRLSLDAQIEFAKYYSLVRTQCLIMAAEHDVFVSNRALALFAQHAPAARLVFLPGAYHEILFETTHRRAAAEKMVMEFFTQDSDNVQVVACHSPFVEFDQSEPSMSLLSMAEIVVRSLGGVVATVGILVGLSMVSGIGTKVLWRKM